MKVLFLDIDGVLNTLPTDAKFGDFDKNMVVNLDMLLSKISDLRVVVSSAWRKVGLEKLQDVFKQNGIDPRKIIATTGHESGSEKDSREYQILQWLAKHPEVRKFVIFDDDRRFDQLRDNFVKINAWVGLTRGNVEKALKILDE